MREFDPEISLVAWLASIIVAPLFPPALPVVIATTINLWHQRGVLYEAGTAFETRVQQVLTARLAEADARLLKMEKDVTDIKEAQIGIQGAFRGKRAI